MQNKKPDLSMLFVLCILQNNSQYFSTSVKNLFMENLWLIVFVRANIGLPGKKRAKTEKEKMKCKKRNLSSA